MRAEMAARRADMQALELRLTLRIGAAVGVSSLATVGVLAALLAIL